ncbi:NAD(P)/FAD-dependent oxidoreductase [Flagellimonas sp. S174]|uniref:NAD(P)/FAD-dependent oxidoreductase n=1 Tax=Flagellimonas sp. S174 TaxID=3410790 RepID=UPI003BF561EF
MKLSYWEYKTWFSNIDFTIVGSGIVGLSCALFLKEKYPKRKVLILEKGLLPQGASTKNAGFACFGSISEILSDLETHSEEEVQQLVKTRWEGIQLLRQILGDKALDYQQYGGHEVFLEEDSELFEKCNQQLDYTNKLLQPIFGRSVFERRNNDFGFTKVKSQYITHTLEGQIDTGSMMQGLLKQCSSKGILVLNGMEVKKLEELGNKVSVLVNDFEFFTQKAFVATNGFASKLLSGLRVKPARAQALITEPIPNLNIKGTFHLDEGYCYFRNLDNRILLGGGRNLDIEGEETAEMGETELIQNKLESLLKDVILPNQEFEIAQRWSGIMGVGHQKTPILEAISSNIFCGVRLGGMGVALGSTVGKDLAGLA